MLSLRTAKVIRHDKLAHNLVCGEGQKQAFTAEAPSTFLGQEEDPEMGTNFGPFLIQKKIGSGGRLHLNSD